VSIAGCSSAPSGTGAQFNCASSNEAGDTCTGACAEGFTGAASATCNGTTFQWDTSITCQPGELWLLQLWGLLRALHTNSRAWARGQGRGRRERQALNDCAATLTLGYRHNVCWMSCCLPLQSPALPCQMTTSSVRVHNLKVYVMANANTDLLAAASSGRCATAVEPGHPWRIRAHATHQVSWSAAEAALHWQYQRGRLDTAGAPGGIHTAVTPP
jgi:hypothetical protein